MTGQVENCCPVGSECLSECPYSFSSQCVGTSVSHMLVYACMLKKDITGNMTL